jgi:cytosine/adenosine deaminase-related metal-dependent hydrolase
MKYISGKIFTKNGFKKGYIKHSGNRIIEINLGSCPKTAEMKGIITPTFVNMHTHIGDAFIKKKNIKLPHDIVKLVAPPNGIKHQLLGASSDIEIINGMKDAINSMILNGTTCFCDFRENGEHGIDLIKRAQKDFFINSIIFSRPLKIEFNKNEIVTLLKKSNGIGLSSIEDWNYHDVEQIVELTKKKHKRFALHVSERIREDINKIIKLQPDFIIHMTQSSKKDLIRIKNENIPIIICPLSNTFFGLTPPIKMMKHVGNMILLGTDNAMLQSPNIINEILHLRKIAPMFFSLNDLFDMVTYFPRKVLNLKDDMHHATFPVSSYILLDERTLQPLKNSILIRER